MQIRNDRRGRGGSAASPDAGLGHRRHRPGGKAPETDPAGRRATLSLSKPDRPRDTRAAGPDTGEGSHGSSPHGARRTRPRRRSAPGRPVDGVDGRRRRSRRPYLLQRLGRCRLHHHVAPRVELRLHAGQRRTPPTLRGHDQPLRARHRPTGTREADLGRRVARRRGRPRRPVGRIHGRQRIRHDRGSGSAPTR